MSLKVIIYLTTASVTLLSAAGNKCQGINFNCADTPVNQMAYVGESVTINCLYSAKDRSNVKYFCREDKNRNCTNVISARSLSYTKLDRFSMMDHQGREVYTVEISMLTQDDAGRYQCALKLPNHTVVCLTKIHLHVLSRSDIIPTKLTCNTGKMVQLECLYPHTFEDYTKYLCKGENPSNCEELIRTTEGERNVTNGKFTIRDNKRTKKFSVHIANPDTPDSGTYWCGFDSCRGKWHHGNFTINQACVVGFHKRHSKTKTSSILTHPITATPSSTNLDVEHSNSGVIRGVAVCLVTIMTAVIVLILRRHRLSRSQGGSPERSLNDGQNTQGNLEGHEYEETELTDPLHYATVNFQTATGSADRSALPGTAENGSSDCDYSSVVCSGNLPPLYSTLTNCKEV